MKKGPLDCRVIITDYRTRVLCIHKLHLFCNALVHVIYSRASCQCSQAICDSIEITIYIKHHSCRQTRVHVYTQYCYWHWSSHDYTSVETHTKNNKSKALVSMKTSLKTWILMYFSVALTRFCTVWVQSSCEDTVRLETISYKTSLSASWKLGRNCLRTLMVIFASWLYRQVKDISSS